MDDEQTTGSSPVPRSDQATTPTVHGQVEVRLRGELDVATVASVTNLLTTSIGDGEVDLVVDLTEVSFLDASTVGVLVEAQRVLAARAARLVLRGPTAPARRVLVFCGLEHLIEPPLAGPPPTSDRQAG